MTMAELDIDDILVDPINIINNYKEEIKNFMIVKPKASSYKELLTLITKVA